MIPPKRSTTTSLHTFGERVRMKTAHAIFGALAAALGLAAVVTFYDEFQTPPRTLEAAQGDSLTPANSITHDFAVLPKFVHITPTSSISQRLCCVAEVRSYGPRSARIDATARAGDATATVDCHGVGPKTCNRPRRVFERRHNFVLAC